MPSDEWEDFLDSRVQNEIIFRPKMPEVVRFKCQDWPVPPPFDDAFQCRSFGNGEVIGEVVDANQINVSFRSVERSLNLLKQIFSASALRIGPYVKATKVDVAGEQPAKLHSYRA
jgi:hypothetical protein